MDYNQCREAVWPFGEDWGTEAERQAVRDYLKRVWKANNVTHSLPPGCESVRTEAKDILEWWWQSRYNQQGSRGLYNYPEHFGTWLLREYRDSQRVNPDNNIVPGPRYR